MTLENPGQLSLGPHACGSVEHFERLKGILSDPDDNREVDIGLALISACSGGNLPAVQYLVEHHSAADYFYKYRHPLNIVCRKNYLPIVHYFVEQVGADIHRKDKEWGNTPLHCACLYGNLAIVQYLVDKNASLDEINESGDAPVHLACSGGHVDVVRYLINDADASVFVTNSQGYTLLHSTCEPRYRGGDRMKHITLIEFLLDHPRIPDSMRHDENNSGEKPRDLLQNWHADAAQRLFPHFTKGAMEEV